MNPSWAEGRSGQRAKSGPWTGLLWVALFLASWLNGNAAEDRTERHWAFLPVTNPSLESLPQTASGHPIDRFIARGHMQAGTRALGKADRNRLIRRAAFDLTGLPPEPERVRAAVNDSRPDAFDRVLDELLASPRYGERWGRHWLDLVRYSDTAGDDSDYPIPEAYRYRDYVIDSFNADLPYDRFVQEQLAGDLLGRHASPDRFVEGVVATGFIAQSKRFATRKQEDMHLIIEDTLNTVGEVVLGLTLRCARCHDHKYDPVTMDDYYALYGFFNSTVYPHPGSEELTKQEDFIPLLPDQEMAARVARFEEQHGKRVAELKEQIERIEKELSDRKLRREKTAALRKELAQLEATDPRLITPVAYAVRDGKPGDATLQVGGDPGRKGAVVPRGVPKFLPGGGRLDIPGETSGRVELARWLTSSENPLTARVMVNRIWQHHFGKGLVSTPSNFGLQGAEPSHPELLDWLAARFVESGWSIKAMHRLIMSSDSWQRASGHDEHNAGIDPANNSYWRFDRHHLDAESIRDSMLLAGGNLDLSRPGPHPFPAKGAWRFTAHHQFKAVYPSNHRSVYLMVQRLHPHPYLAIFNGPSTTASTPVRDASTLPSQALFVSNGDFVQEQAAGLAGMILSAPIEERVERIYALLFSRAPSSDEQERAASFLESYRATLAREEVPAEAQETQAWTALARVLLASNEFFYID